MLVKFMHTESQAAYRDRQCVTNLEMTKLK